MSVWYELSGNRSTVDAFLYKATPTLSKTGISDKKCFRSFP